MSIDPAAAPSRGDRGVRLAVVEEAVEGDVGERVDVAVALVVVVEADVVLGEAHAAGADVDVRHHRHAVIRGLGRVHARLGVSGRLSVTVTPLRTSRAAAATTRSGVR